MSTLFLLSCSIWSCDVLKGWFTVRMLRYRCWGRSAEIHVSNICSVKKKERRWKNTIPEKITTIAELLKILKKRWSKLGLLTNLGTKIWGYYYWTVLIHRLSSGIQIHHSHWLRYYYFGTCSLLVVRSFYQDIMPCIYKLSCFNFHFVFTMVNFKSHCLSFIQLFQTKSLIM